MLVLYCKYKQGHAFAAISSDNDFNIHGGCYKLLNTCLHYTVRTFSTVALVLPVVQLISWLIMNHSSVNETEAYLITVVNYAN